MLFSHKMMHTTVSWMNTAYTGGSSFLVYLPYLRNLKRAGCQPPATDGAWVRNLLPSN